MLDGEGKLLSKYSTGGAVTSVALSADGTTLVAGSEDGRAYGFDVKQSTAGFAAQQQQQGVLSVAVPAVVLLLIVLIVVFLRYVPPGKRLWARYGGRPTKLVRDIWRARVSYILIFPTVALLLVFNYYPAVSGLFHSFTNWKPGISEEWVGLKNFQAVLNNEFLRIGVLNAFILIVTGYIKTLTMPLLVAELLFHLRSTRTQYWLRSLFIFPIVVPGVAIILVWRNIFDPNIGLINNVLAALGLMNMQTPQAWLGDPNTAIWSIVFIGFPFVGAFALLLYYGGLISIPTELFDAVKVDGASGLRRFFSLDLPLLMGQIKLLLILGFIGGMQEFGVVFLTTEGGPYNSTYTPALELYYQAMRFSNFGVASAIGTVLFIVILGGTILNLRMRSATEYQA
jgi:ABC-type sugar transport system permease subunit